MTALNALLPRLICSASDRPNNALQVFMIDAAFFVCASSDEAFDSMVWTANLMRTDMALAQRTKLSSIW